MQLNRTSLHRAAFLFGLTLVLTGLAVSKFLLSIGGLLLAANWLLEGRYLSKIKTLIKQPPALALLGLFALHIIWLFNTADFDYALHDLRIKLPLLLMPVVLATTKPPDQKQKFILLWLFIAALLLGTIMSLVYFYTGFNSEVTNIREVIFFNSPIRFSLLMVLGILFASYQWLTGRLGWLWYALIVVWFTGFMIFVQSLTGLLMMALMALWYLSVWIWKKHSGPKRWFAVLLPLSVVALMVAGILFSFNAWRNPADHELNRAPFATHTSSGTPYQHFTGNAEVENGYYIYRYIAEPELSTSWSMRSDKDFAGEDGRGQELKYTLIRYMTSAGLRKDSSGVAKLSDEDIRRIELGYTSVHTRKNPLIRRLEGTFFEINAFLNGAPPQGGSLSQRVVYIQTGLKVAAKNWLFGTGTGDVNEAMLNQYAEDRSSLEPDFQRRPHNQYLTFLIAFGVAGVIYFIWLNGFAIVLALRSNNFMAIGFTMMAALSFLAEDTLETQIGVSFFAFFYAFLLLPSDEQDSGKAFRFNER